MSLDQNSSDYLLESIKESIHKIVHATPNNDLHKVRMEIERQAHALDSLDYLRASAKGYKSLFEQLPWLDGLKISVDYTTHVEHGRPYKDVQMYVLQMDVNDKNAPHPEVTNFEFAEALEFPDLENRFKDFDPPELFSTDLICLYECLDPNETHGGSSLIFTVRREQVTGDIELDSLAESLFAEKWEQMAMTLDLPYTSQTPRSRIGDRP